MSSANTNRSFLIVLANCLPASFFPEFLNNPVLCMQSNLLKHPFIDAPWHGLQRAHGISVRLNTAVAEGFFYFALRFLVAGSDKTLRQWVALIPIAPLRHPAHGSGGIVDGRKNGFAMLRASRSRQMAS